MTDLSSSRALQLDHVLCFASLFDAARRLCFPCDPQGQVALDSLTNRARNNYLFARATVGRNYAWPVVEAVCH